MSKPENPIQMAVIGAPHGVRGEVRVKSFTGDPLALADYGPLFLEDGTRLDVLDIRPANTVVVVRFKQVASREQAQALTGKSLVVDRAALPDDLEEDEFYHADLIGLVVHDETGAAIGKVHSFHDFGGGDIMEIALAARGTVLVPFSAAAVPELDIAAGRVVIDRVAAGLLDTPGEKPGPDDDQTSDPDFSPTRRPRGPRNAGGNR